MMAWDMLLSSSVRRRRHILVLPVRNNKAFPSGQRHELDLVPEQRRSWYRGKFPLILAHPPGLATNVWSLRSQSSGASFGYMVVWIMSQNVLIHIHGEHFARVEPCFTLTGIPLCAPAEAAEARAQRWYIFGPPGRGIAQNIRPRKCHDDDRGLNLDVQVQIEQAVMVDYDPKT